MGVIRRHFFVVILGVMTLLISACGANQPSPTPAPLPNGTILWFDVPAFNGSAPDINTNLLINQAPPDVSNMQLHTPVDMTTVAAFYSNNLMKQYGWSPQPYGEVNLFSVGDGQGPQIPYGETAGGCDSTFTFHGQPGIDCSFSKTDSSGHHSELDINMVADSDTHQTVIDYVRFESKGTPSAKSGTP